jgi:hypothetical protein
VKAGYRNFTPKQAYMKPQVKYGLATGIATALILITATLAAPERAGLLVYLFLFILTFGLFFAVKDTRDHAGQISFGRGFGIGLLTAIISGVAATVVIYPYFKYIHHSSITYLRKYQMEWMDQNMQSSPDQLVLLHKNINLYFSPGMLSLAVIFYELFFGLMISVMIALIINKTKPGQREKGF